MSITLYLSDKDKTKLSKAEDYFCIAWRIPSRVWRDKNRRATVAIRRPTGSEKLEVICKEWRCKKWDVVATYKDFDSLEEARQGAEYVANDNARYRYGMFSIGAVQEFK